MTRLINARLVLPHTILDGDLTFDDTGIIAPEATTSDPAGDVLDCEGDFIIPGIIDLHTDNLERQVLPRVNARWPSRSAFIAMMRNAPSQGSRPFSTPSVWETSMAATGSRPSRTASTIWRNCLLPVSCGRNISCICAAN